MIKVIHKKEADKYENVIYIGRGSILGNPYTSIQGRETLAQFVVGSRDESIESFKKYLFECIEKKEEKVCNLLNQIYSMAIREEVFLSCYCSPKPCHGDIIKQLIESKIKEKTKKNSEWVQLKIFNKD